MKYEIDLRDVMTKRHFHDKVQETLPCPSYYGRNLDALYDVLTEGCGERELVFLHCRDFARDMPGYSAALRRLCGRAMEECPKLKIEFWE